MPLYRDSFHRGPLTELEDRLIRNHHIQQFKDGESIKILAKCDTSVCRYFFKLVFLSQVNWNDQSAGAWYKAMQGNTSFGRCWILAGYEVPTYYLLAPQGVMFELKLNPALVISGESAATPSPEPSQAVPVVKKSATASKPKAPKKANACLRRSTRANKQDWEDQSFMPYTETTAERVKSRASRGRRIVST